jgi:hypothetical protein
MVPKIKILTVVGIDRSKAETDEKSQKKKLSRKCHNCPPGKPHFTANPSFQLKIYAEKKKPRSQRVRIRPKETLFSHQSTWRQERRKEE